METRRPVPVRKPAASFRTICSLWRRVELRPVKGVAISTDVLVRDIMSGLANKAQLMKARFQSHKVLAEQVISLFYTSLQILLTAVFINITKEITFWLNTGLKFQLGSWDSRLPTSNETSKLPIYSEYG